MSENRDRIARNEKRLQEAHKPCLMCEKTGVVYSTGEEVCGASLKKYESCKHKEHIRNIHNIYMEALIKACENGGKE